jgi:hypothetical protein
VNNIGFRGISGGYKFPLTSLGKGGNKIKGKGGEEMAGAIFIKS